MSNAKWIFAALVLFAVSPLPACTNFCTRGEGLFGRNYDFDIGSGMVIVNKRGLSKRSLSPNHPAQWFAQYASITFNQFGRDIPMDGMNERGLVVALAWLDGTQYPAADARPELNEVEWIQYQLDTAASVDDVLARSQRVRIVPVVSPLHYLVADRDGNTAAIEFLGGQLVVHRNPESPVLANDTYAASAAYLERLRREHATPQSAESLDRFARAAIMLGEPAGGDAVARAFDILDAVAESNTRWSIVYDQRLLAVEYRTAVNRQRRRIALSSFDLGCASPPLILDVDEGSGDVTPRVTPYSFAVNLALAHRSFGSAEDTRGVPEEFIQNAARILRA